MERKGKKAMEMVLEKIMERKGEKVMERRVKEMVMGRMVEREGNKVMEMMTQESGKDEGRSLEPGRNWCHSPR